MLRFALPSKGNMEEPTLGFLAACGLQVERPNARQYVATMPALPDTVVLFQRAADIADKVAEGSADVGITGLDTVHEYSREGSDIMVVLGDLGYARCDLVVAVPDGWIDVSSIADVADLSLSFKEKGRELRLATKYPRLVQSFLYAKGINHFTLVHAQGAFEAAPSMGYAEIIADLTETGTTLRENHLKTIIGGTIFRTQACLIGNSRLLRGDSAKLAAMSVLLEQIEAKMRASAYLSVTANLRGISPEAVAGHVLTCPELAGIQGPTIAKVYSKFEGQDDWYAVTIVVKIGQLLSTIGHLRQIGGSGITVVPARYIFETECGAYRKLLAALKPPQLVQDAVEASGGRG
ncbi:MAG: ATP phosphoribosyltransferase [Chloroflexi bacterium]|nr:ATP phosphoribosyltransferase [Chloroflexota bacterium]